MAAIRSIRRPAAGKRSNPSRLVSVRRILAGHLFCGDEYTAAIRIIRPSRVSVLHWGDPA